MTNREWMNSLSDSEFASKMIKGWCNDRVACLKEDDTRPDITDCNECLLDWLKQEREAFQYITNHEGQRVRVPKVGETVYIVEIYDETQRIKKIKWENQCNYLYLFYYGRIFYSVDDAAIQLMRNESVVRKACKEAGWSKPVDWISGTKTKKR